MIGRDRAQVVGRAIYELPPYAGQAVTSTRLRGVLQAMLGSAVELGVVHLADGSAEAPALWKQATAATRPRFAT